MADDSIADKIGTAVYDQSVKEHWRSQDRPRVGPFPKPQTLGRPKPEPFGLAKLPGED